MHTISRFRISRVAAAGGGLLALLAAGCGGSSPVIPTATGSTIAIVAGNQQTGRIGRPLSAPLVVQVNGQDGEPIVGVSVRWQVIDGGGNVSAPLTLTDAQGKTQVTWTLGATTGTASVTAVIGALATQTAQFTATVVVQQ